MMTQCQYLHVIFLLRKKFLYLLTLDHNFLREKTDDRREYCTLNRSTALNIRVHKVYHSLLLLAI